MLFTALKFAHLCSLLILFSASAAKNLLLHQKPVSLQHIRRCKIADRVSGTAAGFMVLSGIGLLYASDKGYAFYVDNVLFWVKLAILILASALIIRTKIFFYDAFKRDDGVVVKVPNQIRGILILDLLGLVVMSFLGALMASGFYVFR
jgi:putative membrane protein